MGKQFFYYLRDKKNRPIITVCLLKANGDIARGVAICSDKDNPCKKTGRKIAKDRAIYAMKTKKQTSCYINRQIARTRITFTEGLRPDFKAEFCPSLTRYERQLLV